MTGSRVFGSLALALVVGLVIWLGSATEASTQVGESRSQVRLYSGGKVVGEWEAVGVGRLEGETFVFKVKQGVRELEVRIRGSYSVEAVP